MFIWDFVASSVFDQIFDWFYGKLVEMVASLMASMNLMGVELLELPWTQALILFFSNLGFALFLVGCVVAVFECAIAIQQGRGNPGSVGLNVLKGLIAVNLFSTVPVALYSYCVNVGLNISVAISGITDSSLTMQELTVNTMNAIDGTGMFLQLFYLVFMLYAIVKVFFSNVKRGGILFIQIAVGSLYMFGIPRGYIDPFVSWCKQVIGICLTAFLQTTMLIAGLMICPDHMLLGFGMMLAASEVPRIAGAFGLDTTAHANIMGAVYGGQAIVNTIRTVTASAAA